MATSGKFLEILGAVREFPAKVGYDDLRKVLEPERSVVVAHPSPGPDDLRSLCVRQLSECGEFLEKFGIFRHHPGDLSLLEHYLRNEYAIGVLFIPPWKLAAAFVIPTKKR